MPNLVICEGMRSTECPFQFSHGLMSSLFKTGSARTKLHSPDAFQISFPIRSNYMYGRVKKTLMQEIFALTLCLWIKAGVGPGLGTPFSYSAPGQANELVLIEWGDDPMELLIDDKVGGGDTHSPHKADWLIAYDFKLFQKYLYVLSYLIL